MQSNRLIQLSKHLFNKLPIQQMMVAITVLTLLGSEYCFSQSNKTPLTMDTTLNNIQTKNAVPFYLDKNDPIFITIKSRTIADLKQSSDPESANNKLVTAKIETLSKEKQDQLEAIIRKSIIEYAALTRFDVGTFMLVFKVLGSSDEKEIAEEHDIRVQYLDGNKYVAEYWEDGLAVNSEAHALVWVHELATSEYAKKHPDDKLGNVDDVKETYANVRKSIKDGKQERYTKVMALLYTLEDDSSITFHDPFQSVIDFK